MKKYFTLLVFAAICSVGMAQTCDTLFNLQSNLDTPTLIAADTFATADSVAVAPGYLSGNNEFGDLAKAEAFDVTADSGYNLNFAALYFGYVTINLDTTTNMSDTNNLVTIYAWDNTGVSLTGNAAPGIAFDSVQVTLGEIAQAVSANQWVLAYFTGASIYTDTIYIGIVLPSTPGDSVALLTNTAPPGPDGNGWEMNAAGVWSSYNDDWDITSGSLGNYIKVGICNYLPYVPIAGFTYSVYPSTNCSPVTITFEDTTASSPPANSWYWSFGDGTYSNLQNPPPHFYPQGGPYIVTEFATNDTGSILQVFLEAVDTVAITSGPSVTSNITPALDTTIIEDSVSVDTTLDGSAIITVTGGSGYYFATWSTGTFGDTLANAANGTYFVAVQDQNGCIDTVPIIIPLTYPAGIAPVNVQRNIKIYPNPASDLLNIIADKDISGYNFEVYDVGGKLIASLLMEGATNTLNVSSFADGTYIFRITDKLNNIIAQNKFSVVR